MPIFEAKNSIIYIILIKLVKKLSDVWFKCTDFKYYLILKSTTNFKLDPCTYIKTGGGDETSTLII